MRVGVFAAPSTCQSVLTSLAQSSSLQQFLIEIIILFAAHHLEKTAKFGVRHFVRALKSFCNKLCMQRAVWVCDAATFLFIDFKCLHIGCAFGGRKPVLLLLSGFISADGCCFKPAAGVAPVSVSFSKISVPLSRKAVARCFLQQVFIRLPPTLPLDTRTFQWARFEVSYSAINIAFRYRIAGFPCRRRF